MKRVLLFILAMLMILSSVSCAKENKNNSTLNNSDTQPPSNDVPNDNDANTDQTPDTPTEDIPDVDDETDGSDGSDGQTETVGPISREVDERYFIFRIWNFNITPISTFKSTVDAAKDTGFNSIKIHIPWLHVQDFPNKYNFEPFDEMVEYVVSKGMKVAISVDMTRNAASPVLIPEEHLQRDIHGNICKGGVYYDKSVISFSSDYATDLAAKFYKKTVEHFEEKYSDSILFYLPAFTPYCETEYWCVGEYDYSTHAVEGFREFLEEKYGKIQKLNLATGENFASFDEIDPPSCSRVDNFGMLWYQFRHAELKNFIDKLATAQKSVAPDSKLTVQLGSVFDNAGNLRATMGFADLCENVDVIWLDDAPAYNHKFSMDYVRSVLPSHVEIAQEIDGPLQVNASKENYLDQGLTSFERDAKYLSIANWSIDQNYRNYESVWDQIIRTWLTDDPPETLKVTDESPVLEIPLSSFFKSGSVNGYISRYNQLAPNGEAVYIKVVDDLTSREIIDQNDTDEESVSGTFPFNKEQGKDGWYYMSHKNGKFTPMTYDESNERWQGDSEFALIMSNSVHPDACDIAVLYETQKAGELTFSVELKVISGESNGVTYAVYVNDTKQSEGGLSGTLYPNELLKIEKNFLLKKGDTIAIVVGNNGQSSFDTTAISVNISY